MEVLETAREAAPWMLFSLIAFALIIWTIVAAYAAKLEAADEEFRDPQFGDWRAAEETTPFPEPASPFLQSLAKRVIYGLAASILVGEALFVMHLEGWI